MYELRYTNKIFDNAHIQMYTYINYRKTRQIDKPVIKALLITNTQGRQPEPNAGDPDRLPVKS